MFPVLIESQRLRLRELTAADHPALCQLWGDPAIAHYMAFIAMTAAEVAQAIEEAQAEARRRPRSDYTLGAASLAGDVLAGTIRMTVGAFRSVYCGRLTVSRELQNQGYASEIVDLGNRFSFTILQAHRVWGVVHEDNPAAKRALLNSGYTYEGHIWDFFYARGAWHNVDSYSILEHEWPPRQAGRLLPSALTALSSGKYRRHSLPGRGTCRSSCGRRRTRRARCARRFSARTPLDRRCVIRRASRRG